jgi:glucose-6-phosphate isomerase/transaldolase/glucose-6-phosphate isomerase
LEKLRQDEVVPRIWWGDHTVWKPDPTEITNRLGWLTVSGFMEQQLPALAAFAQEIRGEGFRHLVLLGMGGSSLGPEVLRQSFGSAPGYPELIVLDSTVPAWVSAVAQAIDPATTLFLVSSKSGSTTEPNMFYVYFRDLVEKAVDKERAGRHFIAVTDPGTVLERLAKDQGFRRVFLNPSDIGGRYSVLSYFGLVPATITGINVEKLLYRADAMRNRCVPNIPTNDNPATWLGVAMALLARQGRDKLTLITSPAIASFGLWVEQLIAESTGKEGLGIVPVAGEPLASPEHYGQDRFFVYLRLSEEDNSATDAAIEAVQNAGHPVMRFDLPDEYGLGAEFFRWEMATAMAGGYLGVNPFDQPNVQASKDLTDSLLGQYQGTGQSLAMEPTASLTNLLADAKASDYMAIMAYLHQTPELNQALAALRSKTIQRYGVATTLGYGPRFLHSTGQLHKGGPDSGLFLQLTADHPQELAIPNQGFSFRMLADAQAAGDMAALRKAGRRVVRVHLGQDPVAGLSGLVAP